MSTPALAPASRYALIEAGGTKCVVGIAQGPLTGDPRSWLTARHAIPTTTPAETLAACIAWLRAQNDAKHDTGFAGVGIASFGPLCLDRDDPHWGHITATPKPGWANTDLVRPFAEAFGCPVAIDTDVNAAALAEAGWGVGMGVGQGASQGALLYLTIGTGIGGGFVTADGRLLHGLSHPEMGHIAMPRHPEDIGADGRVFAGVCPFHGACLEGLASGPAVSARWGASLSELPADHPGAAMIAWYLGQAIVSFQAVLEPARIVLGGGVMATPSFIERVRGAARAAGAGYFVGKPEAMIDTPALWPDSGLLGALRLCLVG